MCIRDRGKGLGLRICILYLVFQEIYEEEGLQMEEFESPYTQQCIELLCGLDNSIFTIMNEVCNHPKQVKLGFHRRYIKVQDNQRMSTMSMY